MTKDEALKRSLEQLEFFDRSSHQHGYVWQKHLITAIKEALAGPDEDAIIIQYHEATIKRLENRIKELTAQPEERNFCPRCGKRTADLTTIHTCTPPRESI